MIDFGSILSTALSFLIAFAPLEGAVVYVLRFYLPRYLDKKFDAGIEQVEAIVYGLFTPTEEAIVENGVIVQPKGTVPIVAALTPLVAAIPGAIGVSLGEAVKGALQSVKMGSLGALGNQRKQEKMTELSILADTDPVLQQVLESDQVDPDLKQKFKFAAPLLRKYVGVSVTDLTDLLVKAGMEKVPAIKETVEKVKAALVVGNAEKIA